MLTYREYVKYDNLIQILIIIWFQISDGAKIKVFKKKQDISAGKTNNIFI